MKGYKVFNPDWTCRGFQFEVGKTYEEEGTPVLCKKGFHFCENIVDCFRYYEFNPKNKVAEIEAIGEIAPEKEKTKKCTNRIKITKELSWENVLNLCNTGNCNTGYSNTGNCNTGNWNDGNRNTGDCNTGSWNTGNCNTGNWNTGNCNTGNWNTGNCNTGNWNTGNWNTGNWNTGNWNTGDWNAGDWNAGDWNAGCFNTIDNKMFIFNKLSEWNFETWFSSKARNILKEMPFDTLIWKDKNSLSQEEKDKYKGWETTGGCLVEEKRFEKRQQWWNELSKAEKKEVLSLPNFNKDIFKEITGIDVEKETIC